MSNSEQIEAAATTLLPTDHPCKGHGKPGKSGPPGNQNATKHGLYARDVGRIDLRTRLDKAVVTTMRAIEADLGGADALSAQKRVILESIRRKLKNVLKIDQYLDGRSIVDKRRRCLIPVVREQMGLLEGIRRDLIDLGLERRAPELPTLQAYLARKANGAANTGQTQAEAEPNVGQSGAATPFAESAQSAEPEPDGGVKS